MSSGSISSVKKLPSTTSSAGTLSRLRLWKIRLNPSKICNRVFDRGNPSTHHDLSASKVSGCSPGENMGGQSSLSAMSRGQFYRSPELYKIVVGHLATAARRVVSG